MGAVEGIFNLAAVLIDALFKNQTVETFEKSLIPKGVITQHLDDASRQLCPEFLYFVVTTSVICGHGGIGQANYAMANSVMERICEQRKKEGYPALTIQWGAIGDVGLVADNFRELLLYSLFTETKVQGVMYHIYSLGTKVVVVVIVTISVTKKKCL